MTPVFNHSWVSSPFLRHQTANYWGDLYRDSMILKKILRVYTKQEVNCLRSFFQIIVVYCEFCSFGHIFDHMVEIGTTRNDGICSDYLPIKSYGKFEVNWVTIFHSMWRPKTNNSSPLQNKPDNWHAIARPPALIEVLPQTLHWCMHYHVYWTALERHSAVFVFPWHMHLSWVINTSRPRQNGRLFPDDILKCILLKENISISIGSDLPALVKIMAWRRPGDKPLSEPMMVNLLTHISVTWRDCHFSFLKQRVFYFEST